eukprot:TRINITY_DN934_c0_g1_i1.p1 TRINITY_DN934_c0_g1~~TRINITY_DN934_c0_g1_i1.p1  ORF type:complete len:202 (-),score=0.03 TRINITY_DN934_c0_g1_i1:345-908(-)
MAAQVASYDLSLRQEGDRVLFGVALNTQEAPVVEVTRDLRIPDPPSLRDLPAQLPSVRVFILDDAAASRRILEHQLHVHCPSSCVRVFGDAESDIDLFMAMAVNDADIVILDQHLGRHGAFEGLCRVLPRYQHCQASAAVGIRGDGVHPVGRRRPRGPRTLRRVRRPLFPREGPRRRGIRGAAHFVI